MTFLWIKSRREFLEAVDDVATAATELERGEYPLPVGNQIACSTEHSP